MASTKILIVEDESIVALDLRRILTRAGYTVTQIVSDGAAAIAAVQAQQPEAVLMDIGLSGNMDGITTSQHILESADIPIIYVTANSDFATVQQAKTTNPFGYVLKPFDEREIRIVVEMALYKHQLDQEIKENRAWLSATLHSIGDAVIATDADAAIKFMNPIAENLTGWTEAEAIGKPLSEIFRIINENTRLEVVNPAHRALQEGKIVGLANHTLLIARDGTELNIDDSAAPIFDSAKKVKGVVLTFRDVSEKHRIEEAVRQSRAQLSAIVDSAMDAVITIDAQQRIVLFNKTAESMFKRTSAEVIGQPLEILMPHSSRGRHPKLVENFAHTNTTKRGLTTALPVEGVRSTGETFPLEVTIAKTKVGKENLFIAIARDITERRRAEDKLRESEHRFRTIFETMSDGVILNEIIYNENGEMIDYRILEVNHAFYVEDDYGDRNVVGKLASEVYGMSPETIKDFWETHRSQTTVVRTEMLSPLNNNNWLNISISPFANNQFIISFHNITKRKRSEESLRKLSQAVEQSASTILITDKSGRIEYVNPRFTETSGYNSAEALGKNPNFLKSGHTPQEEYREMWRKISSGEEWHGEFHNKKKNGELYWEFATLSPILNQRGEITNFLAVKEDITERKHAEDKLRQQNEYLATLHETSLALLNRLDMMELLEMILTRACQLIGTPNGAIDFFDDDKKGVQQVMGIGVCVYKEEEELRHTTEEGISGEVLRQGKAVIIDEYDSFPRRASTMPKGIFHSMIGVPLRSSGELAGVLELSYTESDKRFSAEQVSMLENFAELASIAIDNARLYTSAQQEIKERKNAEDAFRLAASQLRLLTDNMMDMITRTDMKGEIIYASPSHKIVLGYDPDWLMKRSLFEFVHPDDLPKVMKSVQTGRESTGSGRVELRYRRSDSQYIWLETIGNLLYDDENKMSGAVFSSRDVTKRKQAESLIERNLKEGETLASISRVLNESLDLENILQLIADSSRKIVRNAERAVIHLLDEESMALRAAAISGIENRNQPMVSMRRGEGIAGRVLATGKLINVGDTQKEEGFIPLRSDSSLRSVLSIPIQRGINIIGTLSTMSVSLNAFSADDESILARLGVQAALAIDKARTYENERRRAEQAEAIYQVTQNLIGHINLNEAFSTIVNVIAQVAKYKYVRIFLIEQNVLSLKAQNSDSKVKVTSRRLNEGIIGRVVNTGMPTLVPNVMLDPDYVEGMPGVQSAVAVPIKKDDVISGVVLIESDENRPLTAHDLYWLVSIGQAINLAMENVDLYTNLQESLKQEKNTRTQLVRTEKLAGMGRLIASVAHELNNPLQAIQNALFLVKHETGLSIQANEDLQVALGEADRMAELIGRLRETYRPTTADKFQPASLNSLVIETQRLMTTHARHNNVTFNFVPDPDLPLIACLQDEIKQVLLNLSLNAVEAMPNGGTITVSTGHSASQPEEVWVTITDTGIGIDPNTIASIFDPFFTTKSSGTGLGLFITHEILQKHNGRIEVESQRNIGTTFKATFPAYNASKAPNI